MPRKRVTSKHFQQYEDLDNKKSKPKVNVPPFRMDFLNPAQKLAWSTFNHHDVLFLLGPAGCGKTFLSCGYAIQEMLGDSVRKIVMTRPIVEAGESLGFLPGTFEEKVNPYMMPMFDCLEKCVGIEGPQRAKINKGIEIAPLAYMRGRTFDNSICIFDEAQNANHMQIKLFLTRMGQGSKMILTGDPTQCDIRNSALLSIAKKLEGVRGVGIIEFQASSIVRHPLLASILEKLDNE